MASYTYAEALYLERWNYDRVIQARKLDWMKNLNVERECVKKPVKFKINLKMISKEKEAHLLNNSIKRLCKENDKNPIVARENS